MTELLPWSQYKKWHELLDAICVHQGHFDNARLAGLFCATVGNTSHSAFEAAQKNIANWRTGRHTPNRGNFLILSKILTVQVYADLAGQWNALYAAARGKDENGHDAESENEPPGNGAAESPKTGTNDGADRRRLFIRAGVAMLVVAAGVAVAYFHWAPPKIEDSYGYHGQPISPRRVVDLKVGESAIIHGMRGRCGKEAPDWETARRGLPELLIGTFSDGGVGIRNSRSCSGPTPARAIRFTATKPGKESFELYDDPITITVNN